MKIETVARIAPEGIEWMNATRIYQGETLLAATSYLGSVASKEQPQGNSAEQTVRKRKLKSDAWSEFAHTATNVDI